MVRFGKDKGKIAEQCQDCLLPVSNRWKFSKKRRRLWELQSTYLIEKEMLGGITKRYRGLNLLISRIELLKNF